MHGIVLFKDKWLMIFVLQISFCITRAKCKLEVMYSVNDFRKLCTGFFVFKTFLYQMIRSNYSDTVKTAWQYNALFYLVKTTPYFFVVNNVYFYLTLMAFVVCDGDLWFKVASSLWPEPGDVSLVCLAHYCIQK